MPVTPITSLEDFHRIINSGKPVVIDLWATWCGPCRTISPVFEKHSDADENKQVEFYKVDVDTQPEIAEEIGVRAMPTFVLFQNGEKIETVVGANPPNIEGLIMKGVEMA